MGLGINVRARVSVRVGVRRRAHLVVTPTCSLVHVLAGGALVALGHADLWCHRARGAWRLRGEGEGKG